MRPDVEQNRKKILMTIRKNGPIGISTLVRETGFDKKTVIKYCGELKKEGVIQKNGRFGKYYLTTNAYQYPAVKAGIFQMEAMKEIFWPSRNKNYYHNYSTFYKKQLSDFAHNIGAFISYSLIRSMAPDEWNPKKDKISIAEKTQGIGKDTAIKQWLDSCIRPSQILWEFSNLAIVKEGLTWSTAIAPPSLDKFLKRFQSSKYANLSQTEKKTLKENAKKKWIELNSYQKNKKSYFSPDDPYQSRFELNEVAYNELIKAFKALYPDVHEKLERVWSELDDEIKRQISLSKDPGHDRCKGQRIRVKKGRFENREQCTECKRYFY